MGVRVRDVRMIPGRGQKLANAAQIGAVPPFRYIVVTDYLVDHLSPDEVDAVVAHELGHARRHHVLIKLGTLVACIVSLQALAFAARALTDGPVRGLAGLALMVGFPLGLVLSQGIIGVRLEEQADDDAARATSVPTLRRALAHIGELNHTKARTGWWWNTLTQHPGLADRLDRLEAQEPELARSGR
jgi:STE24 endopeptidase